MKETPNNIEIERLLLGAFLTHTDVIQKGLESGLVVDSFYDKDNQTIFNAMLELNDDDKRTDMDKVIEQLKTRNKSIDNNYIYDLQSNADGSKLIENKVDTLEDLRIRRNISNYSQSISDGLFGSNMTTEELLDDLESKLMEITSDRRTKGSRSAKEILPEYLEKLRIRSESGTTITGMATGYSDLDRMTGGLQSGELIVIGARPSVGKTAFALNLGLNMAHLNRLPSMIFSLEMSDEKLIERLLATQGDIAGNKLRDGRIYTNEEWDKVIVSANDLSQTPIEIVDVLGVKMSEVFSQCRKLKNDKGLGVIIIDYLQLMDGADTNRQEEISKISRGLKKLARELEVPVIALSQLNREGKNREDKRPLLSDLRESGAIEQDSDIVMFLHREDYQNKNITELNEQETEVIIRKHRNGATGTVKLMFTKNTGKFDSMPQF